MSTKSQFIKRAKNFSNGYKKGNTHVDIVEVSEKIITRDKFGTIKTYPGILLVMDQSKTKFKVGAFKYFDKPHEINRLHINKDVFTIDEEVIASFNNYYTNPYNIVQNDSSPLFKVMKFKSHEKAIAFVRAILEKE